MNQNNDTPATLSADEEIERIADLMHDDVSKVFHRSLAADSRPVIRKRLEELAALLSASHANEREKLLLANIEAVNSWKTWGEEQSETARKLSYQNDNLVRDLAAREGELEWMTADRDVATKDRTDLRAQLSALQNELETSNKTIQALQEELEYCPTCDSLRSQLTEAQAEKERIRGQLISHERMAAKGVYVETEKYEAMVAQLTEAQSKRDQWGKELGEAQQAIDTLTRQLKGVEGELVQARCSTQVAEDDFIDRLFSILNERGIDTSNWDGEDDSAVIIANNIVSKLSEANAKLAEVAYAKRSVEKLRSEGCTPPNELSSLRIILNELFTVVCP